MNMEIDLMSQGMELNALYQQNIDLGVNWPLFEPIKNSKGVDVPDKFGFESQDYIVDGETGEFLPISRTNAATTVVNNNETPEFNLDEFLESGITSDPQGIQLINGDNTDTINKELWDDIATLSEAYLALDSGECAKQEMSASPMTQHAPFQASQYQNDVFNGSSQIQMLEQKPVAKEQYVNIPYPNFPTPPYNEQSDHATAFPTDPINKLSPASLEEVKLTEMMMTQQQNDLLLQLDNVTGVPNAPPLNAEQVSAPGGWFLDGDEPTTNLTDVLAELDIMNNMQRQPGPYMDPASAPYVPPPLGMETMSRAAMGVCSESESLDSGYADKIMEVDLDIHEISHVETNNTPLTARQQQERIKKMKQRESRDKKKARELNISLTLEEIINTPVEEYNELLNRANLNAEQQSLVRDIRRRGKNKVAAQNCRKRKIETISSMEMDIEELNEKRRDLMSAKKELEATKSGIQARYNQLYQQIFDSLRDESGLPYDRSRYSLKQVEGAIILVPGAFGAGQGNASDSKAPVSFFDLSKVKIEKDV